MATLTLTLTGVCSGGNHMTYRVTGDRTGTIHALRDDMLEQITEEELLAWAKVTQKMAKAGRTAAQARAMLQAGVTVTI